MLHHSPRRFTMKHLAAEAVIDSYEVGRMPLLSAASGGFYTRDAVG